MPLAENDSEPSEKPSKGPRKLFVFGRRLSFAAILGVVIFPAEPFVSIRKLVSNFAFAHPYLATAGCIAVLLWLAIQHAELITQKIIFLLGIKRRIRAGLLLQHLLTLKELYAATTKVFQAKHKLNGAIATEGEAGLEPDMHDWRHPDQKSATLTFPYYERRLRQDRTIFQISAADLHVFLIRMGIHISLPQAQEMCNNPNVIPRGDILACLPPLLHITREHFQRELQYTPKIVIQRLQALYLLGYRASTISKALSASSRQRRGGKEDASMSPTAVEETRLQLLLNFEMELLHDDGGDQ